VKVLLDPRDPAVPLKRALLLVGKVRPDSLVELIEMPALEST
jgi:hypothetical protein